MWSIAKGLFSSATGALTGQLWKIGTFAALGGCVVLTGFLIAYKVEISSVKADAAAQHKLIEDPKTGFIAQLAQSHLNTITLDQALAQQNAAVDAQAGRDKAALDAAEAKLAAAGALIARLDARAAATLAYKPSGDTACARTDDVIHHYLEGLK